jgi:site-specific recombinase XerD
VGHPLFDVEDLKRSHLDIWKRLLETKYPAASVAAKLAPVLSFLRFCYENDWVSQNVGDKVYLPRINRSKGKTEAFSEAELKIILGKLWADFEKAREPYVEPAHAKAWLRYVIFLTMVTVGMRVSEVVN